MLFALQALGALGENAVGLSVGAGQERLLWALANRIRLIVASDVYGTYAEREFGVPADFAKDPACHAPVAYRREHLAAVAQDACHLQLTADRFDFVYSVAMLQHLGGRASAVQALQQMARVVKPNGLIAVATDLMLRGDCGTSGYSPDLLVSDLVVPSGLELVEEVDFGVSGSTLETTLVDQRREGQLTSVVVLLRKPAVGWCPPDVLAPVAEDAARRRAVVTPARPPIARTSSSAPRIGVDVRTLSFPGLMARGIGHYTEQHLDALAQQAPGCRFVCYGDEAPAVPMRRLLEHPNVEHRAVDDFAAPDVDLFHVPNPMYLDAAFESPFLLFHGAPTSVMFHDLIPARLYWQNWAPAMRRTYLSRLKQMCRADPVVLTNSEFTRRDVLESLPVRADRVHTVLAGLNCGDPTEARQMPEERRGVAQRLGIDGPFFLHVGSLDDNKNFDTALGATVRCAQTHRARLVVVGKRDAMMLRVERLCRERGHDHVVFTGFLPRGDLEALYAEATALVFLSHYEGFGLPVLEAMAHGCPVVCSNATSLPEVAGEAALLVAPTDEDAAVGAMTSLLERPALGDELRDRGRSRAAAFAWSDTAAKTLRVWSAEFGLEFATETADAKFATGRALARE